MMMKNSVKNESIIMILTCHGSTGGSGCRSRRSRSRSTSTGTSTSF